MICLACMTPSTSSICQPFRRDTTKQGYLQLICQTGLFRTDAPKDSLKLPGSFYNALDIRFGWKSQRNGIYRTLYRHPTFGLGFYAATFARPEIGSPNAIYGFVDFPFWNRNKKWAWTYSLALGLSYNFNPYDQERNPLNTLIGSRQNAFIHFHGRLNHKIDNRLTLGMGMGFTHFSNGAYRLPNIGVNKGSFLISAQYRTSRNDLKESQEQLPAYVRKKQIDVYWSNGLKNYQPGGAIYWKTGLGILRSWSIDHRYRLGIGLDAFYRSGNGTLATAGGSATGAWSAGTYLAWEWMITERLYLPVNVGGYLHRNIEQGESKRIYERIGIRYKINRQWFTGVAIKANLQVADFTEWTIGYTPRKKN